MKGLRTIFAASFAAAAVAATAQAAAASTADEYVPFVTDFPRAEQSERYVPFVTDFPNYSADAPPAGGSNHVSHGDGWVDAAFGGAAGVALAALAAVHLARRRRTSDKGDQGPPVRGVPRTLSLTP